MTQPSTITYHVGDVRDVMATLDPGSVDLVVTSPPFLALRSYLPADHPDKHREIGSEATPAAFLDTMLGLTADWRRLLAPHGSIAVEIGDTYSGSGGGGGDYLPGGLRENQPGFGGSAAKAREGNAAHWRQKNAERDAWPLAKSLCGIPTLYTWSLAYARNLLTGDDSPAGAWRIRNLLTWTRPNPPVGALGDKFRPATSFVTVACVSDKRWFDLDAVRTVSAYQDDVRHLRPDHKLNGRDDGFRNSGPNPAGAPPLDWWDANDWQPLHRLTTQPYAGSHYAAFPVALPQRLIEAMCPREVCGDCGEPRRRIVERERRMLGKVDPDWQKAKNAAFGGGAGPFAQSAHVERTTLGWTDCGHDPYRPGIVLDPFGGSGTTAVAAALTGRDAVLIDIDHRNVDLARQRISEQLRIVDEHHDGDTWTWTVEAPLPAQTKQVTGQLSILDAVEAATHGS